MRIRAGRLRHRLTLQSKTCTRDSYGAAIVAWATVRTVWGAIEPLSGRELTAQSQVQAEAQVKILLRYTTGIDTTWRVSHDSKYYDILAVINHDEKDYMLTLLCRQGVSEDVGTVTAEDEYYVVNNGVYVVNSGVQVVYTS